MMSDHAKKWLADAKQKVVQIGLDGSASLWRGQFLIEQGRSFDGISASEIDPDQIYFVTPDGLCLAVDNEDQLIDLVHDLREVGNEI